MPMRLWLPASRIADYFFLKGEMDNNMPHVTNGQKEQFATLDATWQPLRKKYEEISTIDIPALNALCRKAGIDRVMMPHK